MSNAANSTAKTGAAKSRRVKQEAVYVPVPQSREETATAIAEIGRHQRERDRIQADMNDELTAIKERYEREAAPHLAAIQTHAHGVQLWCEAHRAELTQEGKVKTAQLATGEVKWRTRPPSVSVRGVEAVLETLKKLGLARFVRTKEELNKEAILAEPEAIQGIRGVTIGQGEDFVIVPFETKLEEVR